MDSAELGIESLSVPSTCSVRFDIRRVLSRGGMGVVCVAWDRTCGRWVAVKFLREEYSRHVESNDRLVREAVVMGRLRHPGVPGIYDMGVDPEGRSWYAMRLIDGRELREEIDRCHLHRPRVVDRHWRSFRLLLRHVIYVCRTIQWAHEAGFIHRDLKPANIFVSRHGESVVLDWGLAGLCGANAPASLALGTDDLSTIPFDFPMTTSVDSADGATSTGPELGVLDTKGDVTPSDEDELATAVTISDAVRDSGREADYLKVVDSSLTQHDLQMGTPAYLAPEMRRGRKAAIDKRSDVYLLGATLFHLCTAESPHGVTFRKSAALRTAMQSVGVAKDLIAICLQAMSDKPEDRYESAEKLADDLEHYLEDEPIAACVESPPRKLARVIRRHWRYATAVSLVLLTLTFSSVGVWIAFQRERGLQLEYDLLEVRRQNAMGKLKQQERETELANLYRDVNEWERLFRTRSIGWMARATALQSTIIDQATLDPAQIPRIRGLALKMAMGHDVVSALDEHKSTENWPNFHAGCLAIDRRNGFVALGQSKANLFVGLQLSTGSLDANSWNSLSSISLLQGTMNLLQTKPQPGYRSACFSSDGNRLFVGTRDGDVFAWSNDAEGQDSWKSISSPNRIFKTVGTITALAMDPQDDCLWIATDRSWLHRLAMDHDSTMPVDFTSSVDSQEAFVQVGPLVSRRMLTPIHQILPFYEHLYISPSKSYPLDGQTLKDVRELASIVGESIVPHPDRLGVMASGPDRRLWIRHAATGDILNLVAHDAPLDTPSRHAIALSAEGAWMARTLASPTGSGLEIWDMTDRQLLGVFPIRNHLDTHIRFDRNSDHLWVAGPDIDVMKIQAVDPRIKRSPTFSVPIRQFVGGEFQSFISTQYNTCALNSRPVEEALLSGERQAFPVQTDQKAFVASDIRYQEINGTRVQWTVQHFEDVNGRVEVIRSTRDEESPRVATRNYNEVISAMGLDDQCRLWTVLRGKKQSLYTIDVFDPHANSSIEVKPLREVDLDSVFSVASFESSGDYAVLGMRMGSLHIYDTQSLKQTLEFSTGDPARINAMAFAPQRSDSSNRTLAVGRDDGGLVVVELAKTGDVTTHRIVAIPPQIIGKEWMDSSVVSLQWLDENRLLCGTSDGLLRVLDYRSGSAEVLMEVGFLAPCIKMDVLDETLVMHFEGDHAVYYVPIQVIDEKLMLCDDE